MKINISTIEKETQISSVEDSVATSVVGGDGFRLDVQADAIGIANFSGNVVQLSSRVWDISSVEGNVSVSDDGSVASNTAASWQGGLSIG